jgi:hypothetical protein
VPEQFSFKVGTGQYTFFQEPRLINIEILINETFVEVSSKSEVGSISESVGSSDHNDQGR